MQLDTTLVPPSAQSQLFAAEPAYDVHPDSEKVSAFIDMLELEPLALVMEAALKVHTIHQFFCWTQGLLQNLIPHELLICAMRKGEVQTFTVDSFSSIAAEPILINNLFNQDTWLVPHLIKLWEANHYRPVIYPLGADADTSGSGLASELFRNDATHLLAHGTCDTSGRPASFYIFASHPGVVTSRQAHLAELMIPSLHSAWVHTQIAPSAEKHSVRGLAGSQNTLTPRELEILGWINLGKSNIEIGIILSISPLTVKNHVQKILRRLDVNNRAQAVGKALVLRILDGSAQR